MAKYINREALEVELNHRLSFLMAENSEYDHYTSGYDEAVDTVETFPSAVDVAPVVWCKDCTHYGMGVCLKIYSDGNAHPETWQSRRPDDFCSYGERKDGSAENG